MHCLVKIGRFCFGAQLLQLSFVVPLQENKSVNPDSLIQDSLTLVSIVSKVSKKTYLKIYEPMPWYFWMKPFIFHCKKIQVKPKIA